MHVSVAVLQLCSCGLDQQANLRKGDDYCRRAARAGADIVLFPEMWNIGYMFPDQHLSERQWLAQAIDVGSPYFQHFRTLAKELNVAIAMTYLQQWSPRPRNAVSLIDRHGSIVLTYAKVHTCEFGAEAALTPGSDFPVAELDTAQGIVRVGAMICYDREFPESARMLMLNGAELILVPNACEMEDNRLMQLRTRAYENMLGIALANYAAPEENGHSVAFDGMAFADGASRDHMILQAGETEGKYLATFNLDRMRAYRENETWGNAYRRPRCYAALLDETVAPPFVRPDATR
ncbi:MAG TPA: carbon-nitrogen hydrolase family protein [Armatimonadota bacterium]|nr:carbon-nitrogen hydrolase family protein [Armatimonadota bacterium]